MSLESFEEEFLKNADKCPKDNSNLKDFKKFIAETEFIWVGWCDVCNRDVVTIHGNNPKLQRRNEMKYDSEAETRKHIAQVGEYILGVIRCFTIRISKHDASKLSKEEKILFDKYTPKLAVLYLGN